VKPCPNVDLPLTLRHQSRDPSTPDMQFPIGGSLKPSLYVASLLRYYVSDTVYIENAFISFLCFRGHNRGLQHFAILRSVQLQIHG